MQHTHTHTHIHNLSGQRNYTILDTLTFVFSLRAYNKIGNTDSDRHEVGIQQTLPTSLTREETVKCLSHILYSPRAFEVRNKDRYKTEGSSPIPSDTHVQWAKDAGEPQVLC